MSRTAIAHRILQVLEVDHPKPRAYVEAVLVYQHQVQPNLITGALKQSRLTGAVRCHPLDVSSQDVPTHIYSLDDLSHDDERLLREMLLRQREVFDPQEMRLAGEGYVRSLAIRSRQFLRVPQRHRLGNISCQTGRLTADLILTRKSTHCAIRHLIVEVKNCREWFYPSAIVFKQLLEKAVALKMLPVLCAAHVSPEARAFCNDVGIAVLSLDRQLMPKRRRKEVEGLRSVIGPAPIEYVGSGLRFYQNEKVLPALATRDLELIGSGAFFDEAEATWLRNRDMVAQFLSLPWHDARFMIASWAARLRT